MALRVCHAVGVKILCSTLIGCGGMFIHVFEYPYVMNLPHSYKKCAWYLVHGTLCRVPSAANGQEGVSVC